MRLVVDNWILTTVKHNEIDFLKNEQRISINKRVEQEQNLFDSARINEFESFPLNYFSYWKPKLNERLLNEMEQLSDVLLSERLLHTQNLKSKVDDFFVENSYEKENFDASCLSNQSQKNIQPPRMEYDIQQETNEIKDFLNFLYIILDVRTYTDAKSLIGDFLKVRNYLIAHRDFIQSDNHINFENQHEIVSFLKDNLRIKQLIFCQSIGLFEQFRIKLFELLDKSVSDNNLDKCTKMFNKIRINYLTRLENLKAILKLKITRLEKSVNTWNEFENTCSKLENIFGINQTLKACSLDFRSLSIEINNLINRLKEKWNLLTIVLNETKYFEFKNLIIFYELEFKKIKDTYYKRLSCSSPEAIVPSLTAKCINRNLDRSSESISIPINYKLIKRTVLTSEKSTSTINNESTQTDFMYDTIIQSDGKKLLLEAYLRNNNLSHHKNKSESCTGIARESGIGTTNDDESLSLTDIEKQCDDDYKHNLSFETFPFESSKRYLRRKLGNLKSNSTISTSSSSSSKLDEKNKNQKNKSKKFTKEQINSNNCQKNKKILFNNVFKKIVNFLIIFLIPCFFILLFFAFILYRSYVFQNCCDYNRNHLFINLT